MLNQSDKRYLGKDLKLFHSKITFRWFIIFNISNHENPWNSMCWFKQQLLFCKQIKCQQVFWSWNLLFSDSSKRLYNVITLEYCYFWQSFKQKKCFFIKSVGKSGSPKCQVYQSKISLSFNCLFFSTMPVWRQNFCSIEIFSR